VAADSRRIPPTQGDPDFDMAGPAQRRVELLDDRVEHFQKLVVNPFLAVFVLVGSWACIIRLTGLERMIAISFAILGAPFLYLLVQYHCRDCGRTGTFRNWPLHECETVAWRKRQGARRRWCGPSPEVQLKAWLCLIGVVALLRAMSGKLP
jgi:hypothetical protein